MSIPFYKLSEEEFAKKKIKPTDLKSIKDIYLHKDQGLLFVYNNSEEEAMENEIFKEKPLENIIIFN